MIQFFKKNAAHVIAVECVDKLTDKDLQSLQWLFDGAHPIKGTNIKGKGWIGPRKEMITPWSTNAVEITQNMGIKGITRIEEFFATDSESPEYDKMLQRYYPGNLGQKLFTVTKRPEKIKRITDLESYNLREGLALSPDEIKYLKGLAKKLKRPLTDSEVFGFSQVNSEHCRHKIFNGTFIIDGKEMPSSLFKLIKKSTELNPNAVVSAYKDNVAFLSGPVIRQFAPVNPEKPDYFCERDVESVISLKAETHNFPTTVEPFNGAATGTGGEIRDRMGGGKASLPIAGTAVYMTSYPRPDEVRDWETNAPLPRPWLYQTPSQILIKASNGASDFGNKFGQPLICGSLLTFEHQEHDRLLAYDKVIMLAGGVGFGTLKDAIKQTPEPGMKVVVMGGDNYRIGMGGGAVSSVETGQYDNSIELNAVQRANPEMQKRVSNVVRALAEMEENPCVTIHDHGAGGHLNALSELVEATGGRIDMDNLPIGDPTLSAKEIIGNESQERMGLVMDDKHIDKVQAIAERERAPFYVVGETTDDSRFTFQSDKGTNPIDLALEDMFGNSPKTVLNDKSVTRRYEDAVYSSDKIVEYLRGVLGLEAVACKDWLTNKVDRSVTGKVARQQCVGELQLPLSDCGVVALDYLGKTGIATSIGHAPQAALIDPAKGSVLAIAEALTNINGALLKEGLRSVSLSANWMWPCKNEGEDAALYAAVKACSDFAIALGINIPTGKDSLSMTQKYGDEKVYAPGTLIISAAGEVRNIRKTTSPVVVNSRSSRLIYIDLSSDEMKLGGSAFFQSLNAIGSDAPTVKDPARFAAVFNKLQKLNEMGLIMSQHDISAGGMVTALLEMTFSNVRGGLEVKLDSFGEKDLAKILFAENPAIIIQVADKHWQLAKRELDDAKAVYHVLGHPTPRKRTLALSLDKETLSLDIDSLRDDWYRSSWLLDRDQSGQKQADARFRNYRKQPVKMQIDSNFGGSLKKLGLTFDRQGKSGVRAAIIREKGVNGDREMAYSLYLAGFDVKDVHMTDLISGRETLEDVNMIVFCGGFSNSDVLGSAKGWAGGFLYNEKAREALKKFYERKDTLSLGICNGCQLMAELNLLYPEHEKPHKLLHNNSHKFESEFISVEIPQNNSVMFGSLSGSRLGIWVAHGEGKFSFPHKLSDYNIVAKYSYSTYPGNPNGSYGSVAGVASADGRHLAMMPHLERAIFPWQCGWYPADRATDEVTPWIEAFVNARKWIENNNK